MNTYQIATTFVALDDSCGAHPLPVTPDFWEALPSGRLGEFSRMVSSYTFASDWTTWERHPGGEEFVCLLNGDVDFVLEKGDGEVVVTLNQPGTYVLVPANTWHTARVRRATTMLFITPGAGTENRPV